jgi:sulfur carrier protein ThiS
MFEQVTFNLKFERKQIMRIMYINNAGGGFANYVNVEEGINIEKLFKQKMPNENAADYLIRVNRQPVPKDYVLKENDRLTITPTKIDGARPVLA